MAEPARMHDERVAHELGWRHEALSAAQKSRGIGAGREPVRTSAVPLAVRTPLASSSAWR